MKRKSIICLYIFFCFFLSPLVLAETERKISRIKDNVYRFQNGRHFSIFVVGKSGFLLTDPINKEAARWLKNKIKSRFGDLPIKYVIFSHEHEDHISGGEEFDEGNTVFIAHENTAQALKARNFSTIPDITFSNKLNIDFEGQDIELRYFGRNNGNGNISLYVWDLGLLFVVDWIVLKRFLWQKLQTYDFEGMIDSVKKIIETYPIEMVAPGHGVMGDMQDIKEYLNFLLDLRSQVLDSINRGGSLSETIDRVDLKDYSHYKKYNEWRDLNITGVYEQLKRNRMIVQ